MTLIKIQHPENSERIFPPTKEFFLQLDTFSPELSSDQKAALGILGMAANRITLSHFIGRTKAPPQKKIGLLLGFYKKGREAETLSKWERADIYWEECLKQGELLFSDNKAVSHIINTLKAEHPALDVLSDPIEFQKKFIFEILITTHSAFYNEYIIEENINRLLVHDDYINKWIERFPDQDAEIFKLYDILFYNRIAIYTEEKNWDKAIELCNNALNNNRNNQDYQNMLVKLHFKHIVTTLSGKEGSGNAPDVIERLDRGKTVIQQLCREYPYNQSIYEAMGHIHHLKAVNLANIGKISMAFIEVQKALTYHPLLNQAHETKQDLLRIINELKNNINKVTGNKEDTGPPVFASNAGMGLGEDYSQSKEGQKIMVKVRIARACSLWQSIGLSVPEKDFAIKAMKLFNTLEILMEQPPAAKRELYQNWMRETAGDKFYTKSDKRLIYAFLSRQLFPSEKNKKADANQDVDPSSSSEVENNFPHLPVSVQPQKKKQLPLLPWLFNHRDKRLKISAVLAIVALITSLTLGIPELSSRAKRNKAYTDIINLYNSKTYNIFLLEAFTRFFKYRSHFSADRREAQVKELYDLALFNCFLRGGEFIIPLAPERIPEN